MTKEEKQQIINSDADGFITEMVRFLERQQKHLKRDLTQDEIDKYLEMFYKSKMDHWDADAVTEAHATAEECASAEEYSSTEESKNS